MAKRLLATLAGFFGGLALLLAIIGLYGAMSYNVTRRRSEIGIRMALGAEKYQVLRTVMGEVAVLIGSGITVGLAITLAATRLVARFLYGVRPNDPADTVCGSGDAGRSGRGGGLLSGSAGVTARSNDFPARGISIVFAHLRY